MHIQEIMLVMIFAAITGTPCIAFRNFNHKIKESYNWIKKLDYIEFCDNISEFKNSFEKIKEIQKTKYNNTFAKDIIVNVLREEIN